eukprot:1155848-Pelagomonas_calceolata.AAC.5
MGPVMLKGGGSANCKGSAWTNTPRSGRCTGSVPWILHHSEPIILPHKVGKVPQVRGSKMCLAKHDLGGPGAMLGTLSNTTGNS